MTRLHSLLIALTLLACLAVGLWASRRPESPRLHAAPPAVESRLATEPLALAIPDASDEDIILATLAEDSKTAEEITPRKLTDNDAAPAGDHPIRRIIARELPESAEEERQIWFDELQHLPLSAVEDLLKVRRQATSLLPEPGTPQDLEVLSVGPSTERPEAGTLSAGTRSALQRYRRVLLQNLLNADTIGYRCVEPCLGAFPATAAADGPNSIEGLRWIGTRLRLSPGLFEATHRSLDLAISGPGWFVVEDAAGQLGFTRNGAFQLNEQRTLELITAGGPRRLQPAILFPEQTARIFIDSNGKVYSRTDGKSFDDSPVLGQILLARFLDDCALELHDDGLYRPLPHAGEMVRHAPGEQCGSLHEGVLEWANVNREIQRQALQRVEQWLAQDSGGESNRRPMPIGVQHP